MSSTVLESRRSRWVLLLAFGGIAVLFAAAYLVALDKAREIRFGTQTLVSDMLASVELVSRMGRDVAKERILVDAHILAEEAPAMAGLEAQIAEVRNDFAANERAYAPLVTSPAESRAWQDLERDLLAVRALVDQVIATSRVNRDQAARQQMVALEDRFSDVARDVDRLVDINRSDADQTLAHVLALQRSSAAFLAGVALIGIALTVIVGTFATRRVHAREDQLSRYSSMLETQNRDLDAFAARVAHDLRGPLTTISLCASRRSMNPEEERGTSAILRRGVERMERLIDDLLALSRAGAQAGGVCDPARVSAQLDEELAPRLAEEAMTLRVSMASAEVRCGEGLLRQALSNLADNAIKYRRPGVASEIQLTGRVVGGRYELRFTDNGIGMSSDEARQVFEPFYRALRARQAPGTGLGLSIVKRVIEGSGGTVSVESRLGVGTTFLIVLPAAGHEPRDRGG